MTNENVMTKSAEQQNLHENSRKKKKLQSCNWMRYHNFTLHIGLVNHQRLSSRNFELFERAQYIILNECSHFPWATQL